MTLKNSLLLSFAMITITACQTTSYTYKDLDERTRNEYLKKYELTDEDLTDNRHNRLVRIENAIHNMRKDIDRLTNDVAHMASKQAKKIDLKPSQSKVFTGNRTAPQSLESRVNTEIDDAYSPSKKNIIPVRPLVPAVTPQSKPQQSFDDVVAKTAPHKNQKRPSLAAKSGVHTVRVADHPDKTRVVIEASEKINYTANIDNLEKILLIDAKNGKAVNGSHIQTKRSALIRSASLTSKSGHGFLLAMPLTKNSSVISQGYLPPNKDNANHRMFIDLSR